MDLTKNSSFDTEQFLVRCKYNIQQLHINLINVGYRFLRSDTPYQFATERDKRLVAQCERQYGIFPDLLRRWYEIFRFVDFRQATDQYNDGSTPVGGLGLNLTLVFLELDKCVEMRESLVRNRFAITNAASQQFLPLGSFASNCEPKGTWLPDKIVDPQIYDEGNGPITFSEELRRAFRSGGFPFWEQMYRKPIVLSPLGFAPNYPQLLDSLLQNVVEL